MKKASDLYSLTRRELILLEMFNMLDDEEQVQRLCSLSGYLLGRKILSEDDSMKYLREIKKILGFQLLILDDFLLNTIMDEREVKVLMEILEKRIEASKSTIVCSQREPGSWKAMIMNDEVSANAIMKRATKHYIVVIQPIEIA